MSDLVTEARRLEAQLAKQRRWIAKLFDDRRKTRAEVTRLHEQFAALADDLDARAEECVAVGEGPASDAAHGAATRIRRILAGTQ